MTSLDTQAGRAGTASGMRFGQDRWPSRNQFHDASDGVSFLVHMGVVAEHSPCPELPQGNRVEQGWVVVVGGGA
jgi:hypothetical protein